VQGVLREGLLDGRRVALVGPAREPLRTALAGLGADTVAFDPDLADEQATEAAAAALGELHALVVDGSALFGRAERPSGSPMAPSDGRSAPSGEIAPLRAAADGAWAAIRAVANAAWIGPERPGKVILVAPPADAGPHAEAARAAYENLARTLSIEWSRYAITTTAITPDTTSLDDVATLVAYVVSTAGDYFSGARLDLR
jgi:NAD(P)-dependent dehydrogenase (short-subunit alcohol dehydrogenase family)